MKKFLALPSFLIKILSLNLILNPTNSRLKTFQSLLIFAFHILNLSAIVFILLGFMIQNHQNIDILLGTSMAAVAFFGVKLKYITILRNRQKIKKLIENLKVSRSFPPEIRLKFQKFEKFKRIFLVHTFLSMAPILILLTRRLIMGETSITSFIKVKIESKFLSVSLSLWSSFVQICLLFINFVTEILICKMIFVTAMEFEELAMKFRMLKEKIFEIHRSRVPLDPLIVGRKREESEIYPNLLSKFPMKVRNFFDNF
jgi:hypothetical protein